MKKHARLLALHRETLLRLNDSALGGGVVVVQDTQQPECYSPLCGPTYWKTCETQVTA